MGSRKHPAIPSISIEPRALECSAFQGKRKQNNAILKHICNGRSGFSSTFRWPIHSYKSIALYSNSFLAVLVQIVVGNGFSKTTIKETGSGVSDLWKTIIMSLSENSKGKKKTHYPSRSPCCTSIFKAASRAARLSKIVANFLQLHCWGLFSNVIGVVAELAI